MKELNNLIGVEEAGEILGFTAGHVKNLCAAGKLPAKKIGNTWVILKDKLEPKEKSGE